MSKQKVNKIVAEVESIIEDIQGADTVFGEKIKKGLKGKPEFNFDFQEIAMRLVAAGMTEKDMAYVFGITPRKIKGWKRKDPLFKAACDRGKEMARSYLVARGLRAAAGYDYVERNVSHKVKFLKDGTRVDYDEVHEFHKHQKPDGSLLMFLLCNLSRQLKDDEPFQSTHKVEVEETKKWQLTLTGKAAVDQIKKLAGAFMPPVIEAETVSKKRRKKKIKSETKDEKKD